MCVCRPGQRPRHAAAPNLLRLPPTPAAPLGLKGSGMRSPSTVVKVRSCRGQGRHIWVCRKQATIEGWQQIFAPERKEAHTKQSHWQQRGWAGKGRERPVVAQRDARIPARMPGCGRCGRGQTAAPAAARSTRRTPPVTGGRGEGGSEGVVSREHLVMRQGGLPVRLMWTWTSGSLQASGRRTVHKPPPPAPCLSALLLAAAG